MRIHTFNEESAIYTSAARYLLSLVAANTTSTLLLLSGGSSVRIYSELVNFIRSGQAGHLRIGMIDERYGPMNHAESNARLIEERVGLWSICAEFGIEYNLILTGQDRNAEVERYGDWLAQAFVECSQRIGVLGMGLDGHTAGIMPGDQWWFDEKFETDQLVVGYDSGTQFDERITITPAALEKLTHSLLVAAGREKRVVFDRVMSQHQGGEINFAPVALLQRQPQLDVFVSEPE